MGRSSAKNGQISDFLICYSCVFIEFISPIIFFVARFFFTKKSCFNQTTRIQASWGQPRWDLFTPTCQSNSITRNALRITQTAILDLRFTATRHAAKKTQINAISDQIRNYFYLRAIEDYIINTRRAITNYDRTWTTRMTTILMTILAKLIRPLNLKTTAIRWIGLRTWTWRPWNTSVKIFVHAKIVEAHWFYAKKLIIGLTGPGMQANRVVTTVWCAVVTACTNPDSRTFQVNTRAVLACRVKKRKKNNVTHFAIPFTIKARPFLSHVAWLPNILTRSWAKIYACFLASSSGTESAP